MYQFVFEQKVAIDRAQGLEADFDVDKHGDRTVYQYDLSGDTINQLQKALTIDPSVTDMMPELANYAMDYTITENPDGTIELDSTTTQVNLGETFTLHAWNINDYGTANEVRGNKAVWTNPTHIHARFTPLRKWGALAKVIGLIVGGVILIAGLIFVLTQVGGIQFRKKKPIGRPHYPTHGYYPTNSYNSPKKIQTKTHGRKKY
jgi:hypothetical protein